MRLRFLPWVWERLELSQGAQAPEQMFVRRLNVAADIFHENPFLATAVKYFYDLLCALFGADSCTLKVRDGISHVE